MIVYSFTLKNCKQVVFHIWWVVILWYYCTARKNLQDPKEIALYVDEVLHSRYP